MTFRSGMLVFLVSCAGFGQDSIRPNPAAAAPEAPRFVGCPAGGPLGAVDLRVTAGDEPLPFRTINHLGEGDTLDYSPVLRGKEERSGEIALVLVPEKIGKGDPEIIVTDPKPAGKHQQWHIEQNISVAALVYGPAGLNRKKVARFLSRDEVLIAQLADYADKTSQAEQLVATLSNSESSSASVNAALNGFASQYGFAVQIDRNAPVAAQAETLFASMNPQLATYNPLTNSTAARAGQTASLATTAATLFFGSPIGLAAGGTAMLLDLRSIAFPDTQFRASFAQPLPGEDTGVNLCGQQGVAPPHTRVAYMWASRIPDAALPVVQIGDASFIPAGLKTPLPVKVPEPSWKYLERARQWELVDEQGKKSPVKVVKLGNQQALEIDLAKGKVPPGDYTLGGFWDWAHFEATGKVHVAELSDFSKARVAQASQDKLISKAGKLPVTLEGSDFEFTSKVELRKPRDEFAAPEAVRFLLAKGLRKGPQNQMDVQIDTNDLAPGPYELLISQQDGKSQPVKFEVLPNAPQLSNLPVTVNAGASVQHFVLKGERLGLIAKLAAPGAVLTLDSSSASNQTERSLTVEWKTPPQPGTELPVQVSLTDRDEPLTFAKGLEVTGPLPAIASSKLSLPTGMAIAIEPGEFPAGYTLNALLDTRNLERTSTLRLACADGVGNETALHIGEQNGSSNLQQLSADQLFLAFDTSTLPAGCSLEASIDNGRDGESKPSTLARIVRVPQIDLFVLAENATASGPRPYRLTGQNLEMIAKAGWDESIGVEPAGLPEPLPGPGLKQSVQVVLPDPPNPQALLYVWLRGDSHGRATTIQAPALPVPPALPVLPVLPAVPVVPDPPPQ
ncbi:MAG TPA: hypothetical protein VHZ74_08805 [Bryobacteraceae bacterium]|nr:hypothetical protein [Bryobacteraceae bacterium]